MEKKTAEDTLNDVADISAEDLEYCSKYNMSVSYNTSIKAMQEYAAQETKPLQERIDELGKAMLLAKANIMRQADQLTVYQILDNALKPQP